MRDGLEGWWERWGPYHGTHRTYDSGCQCVGGWRSIDNPNGSKSVPSILTLGVALCTASVAAVESGQRAIATTLQTRHRKNWCAGRGEAHGSQPLSRMKRRHWARAWGWLITRRMSSRRTPRLGAPPGPRRQVAFPWTGRGIL